MGRFSDVSEQAGIKHRTTEKSASFGDFDNDGFLDLYIVSETGDLLYRNSGDGKFEDVTERAKIGSPEGGNMALFFDSDHDGDLDLFEAGTQPERLFRNIRTALSLNRPGKWALPEVMQLLLMLPLEILTRMAI
jgi:hypothetical protein